MRRNPRIALTALDSDGRDRHVSLSGRIASIDEDKALRDIDRLALHYTGAPFRTRDRRRFSARVEIESWHAWDGRGRGTCDPGSPELGKAEQGPIKEGRLHAQVEMDPFRFDLRFGGACGRCACRSRLGRDGGLGHAGHDSRHHHD
jgi:hypothetical protein